MESFWKKPPIVLELQKDAIHLWRAALNVSPARLEVLSSFLSEEELTQGHRLIKVLHQNRFIAAHGILREILARYLSVSPQTLKFYKGSHGKPYLIHLPLQFNMTHSQDLAIYAVALQKEVGVDVETINPNKEILDIAQRFFSPFEYQQLITFPKDQQTAAFYRYWTCKEAFIKVTGMGLSYPLHNFDINLLRTESNCLWRVEDEMEQARKWCVRPVFENKDYVISAAIEGRWDKIDFYEE